MPPDSPEVLSSPTKPWDSARRKSLVKRSRSRGRRVSFQLEEIAVQSEEDVADELSSPSRRTTSQGQKIRERGPTPGVLGKGNARARADTPGQGMEVKSVVTIPRRGRSSTRGQTPGPPEPVELSDSGREHSAKYTSSNSRRTRRENVDST